MVDFIQNMNPTTLLAIYGAILSTVAIGWNIYNNLQDRPKVKVTGKFGFMDSSKGVEGPFFFVKVINKGRRSVYLFSVGLRTKNEEMIKLKTIGLPCELAEGKSHSEWFKPKDLEGKEFNFAWYRDETGKLYKSKSIRQKLKNYFDSEKNRGIRK